MATPSTPSRRDRRKQRTTASILDAASELFFAQGVQRTTVDELAERADVSVGSVYFHFKSKDGVYLALVEQALDVNEGFMAAAKDDPSPMRRVLNAGDAYLEFFLQRPDAFRLVALRVLEPAGSAVADAERRIADRVEHLVGAVQGDLEAAIRTGEIRQVDPAAAMRFLWGAWNGVIAMSLRQDRLKLEGAQVREALELGRTIVADGLAAR